MRKGLFTLLSLVCAGLIWAAPAPANAADKIVIRFAHSNTPSDMDPYHALVTKMNDKLVEHKQYIAEYGQDLEEIRNWEWHK
jgi:phosphoketolase